jgi:60 kDa SS-A/Ro ribonucleoprotein
VWEALLEHIPITALIRNLGNMTRAGILAPMSAGERRVLDALGDESRILKARVHPIAVLSAMATYARGRGFRGSGEWAANPRVVDALDAAFYTSFGNVKSTGKRWLLALDVSSSMTYPEIAGVPGLTPRSASAAMALLTAKTEPSYMALAFSHQLTQLPLSPRQRLDDVLRMVDGLPFGGTDCALPMLAAHDNGLEVDVFVVYTDSETWAGHVHPAQALRAYREKSGIDAKLIVVGMVANDFSIADPNDRGMLDVVGFDTASPNVMAEFAGVGF